MAQRNKIIVAECFNDFECKRWNLYFDGQAFTVYPEQMKRYYNEGNAQADSAVARELVDTLAKIGIKSYLGLYRIRTNEFGDYIGANKIKSY